MRLLFVLLGCSKLLPSLSACPVSVALRSPPWALFALSFFSALLLYTLLPVAAPPRVSRSGFGRFAPAPRPKLCVCVRAARGHKRASAQPPNRPCVLAVALVLRRFRRENMRLRAPAENRATLVFLRALASSKYALCAVSVFSVPGGQCSAGNTRFAPRRTTPALNLFQPPPAPQFLGGAWFFI